MIKMQNKGIFFEFILLNEIPSQHISKIMKCIGSKRWNPWLF